MKKNLSGPTIGDLRRKRNWSQTELQSKLEAVGFRISRPVIAKIESCSRCVSDFELVAFAKALKVSVGVLLRQRGRE